jgi:protein gp37
MSAISPIQWTDRTWNPVRGCSLVSPGCTNCYAMRQAHRQSGESGAYEGLTRLGPNGPVWTGSARLVPKALFEPLRWRKPQRIFVNSMSDLFHESLSGNDIARVFAIMAACPDHTFQILTKRPEVMLAWFKEGEDLAYAAGDALAHHRGWCHAHQDREWPLSNVWLGVSVENQATADERIPLLLQTPSAVRFVSYEPALGPVDFDNRWFINWTSGRKNGSTGPVTVGPRPAVNWLIVGGESGPRARPCDVAWIRSAVRQCRAAGVPVFVKQLGAYIIDRNDAGFDGGPGEWPAMHVEDIEHDLDGTRDGYQGAPVRVHISNRKGGDPAEWPEDLRVREFPGTVGSATPVAT